MPRRASGRRRTARARGFTLIELLLVMALVAAAAGLVAPQLLRWVDGARERTALQALHSALAALPEQAFFAGQAIELGTEGAYTSMPVGATPLPLPQGWSLRLAAPLRYEANGMTRGGTVDVLAPGRPPVRWRVEPPAGRVREDDALPPR